MLSIVAILAIALPGSAGVSAQESNARIVASITYNWFRAEGFMPDASLNVEIFDVPGGELLWNESRTTDGSGYVHIGEWEHPVNLVPGNFIIISDAATTKELELEAVTLDTFDTSADLLAGTAPAAAEGRYVWVGTGNDSAGCSMDVTADPVSGEWTADFSAQPCDVLDDMWGAAQVFDADGDASEANPLPDPSFVVFPEWEWFDGNNWPDDADVAITVAGKDDCTTSRVSSRYFFNGGFPEGCDIVTGDVVTFTDGVTTRTHTVKPLTIETVDKVANTVSGTADTGEVVHTWVHEYGYDQFITITDGNWLADFGAAGLDLVENMGGRAEIRDGQGNATAVDWWLPNPHFVVFPEWEWYDGWDWPEGATVDITVDDKDECTTSGTSSGNFFNGGFPEGCNIEVGDTVTFADSTTTRTHMVRNLSINLVDLETDTVAGTADEGETVYVWPHETGEQVAVPVGEGGSWSAHLNFDLVPGKDGRSQIQDAEGNATAVDWYVPNPWMIAFPENNAVEGWEWPEGATVTLTIDGAAGQEWSGTAHVTDWGDTRTYFAIELGEDYDLMAGDVVNLTYGETTRTHTVRNLSVTGVDPFADTVAGTADPGTALQVWPHGYDGPGTLDLTAGDDGTWFADFNGVFELNSGTGGRSWILDDAGSATAVDWQVDLPYDIYIFDTWTGSTRQLTTTDLDEYNPTWSPNGKMIAHDGVFADGSHGIFVTDVRTGTTSPLDGAQDGGNDAAWSPNGKWIAFDRRWYGDPNVYLVPAEGGEALLAVENAVAADWAPNGKRLVFERGDGSLATAPIDGGKGAETSLGINGVGPAWSPDGNWIAYEDQGDIWKIAVNVQGKVLAEPVQLTSDALWDGHPTWSADGTKIVFTSGVGDDFDLWQVAAAGGERSWLTGGVEFGDYDPDYSASGRYIAYSSFSPNGQAPRHWVATLTADAPDWAEGGHDYFFDLQYTSPEAGGWGWEARHFEVAADAPLYEGSVSIRYWAMLDRTNEGCQVIDDVLNPAQDTLFQFGWVGDYEMTYAEALDHFASLIAMAHWDGEFSTDFTVHEVIPWTDGLDWDQYSCSFTP